MVPRTKEARELIEGPSKRASAAKAKSNKKDTEVPSAQTRYRMRSHS